MKSPSLIMAVITAALTAAQELTRCGSPEPPANLKVAIDQSDFRFALARNDSRTVDTYAHVVTTSRKQATYTQQNVNDQISVMNSAYAAAGFTFNLLGTSFTVNNAWAAAGQSSPAELAMKTALHTGTYDTLNLYFLSDLGGGLLGFCYFPEANPTAQDKILDGCVNLAGSMPGVNELPKYDLGLTTVHETGHWLGLFHVFQGNSCTGRGDYISDTPAQKSATSGCPASADTCPGKKGVDNIHNYMDYSYDECLTGFSTKQNARMGSIFDQFRAGK